MMIKRTAKHVFTALLFLAAAVALRFWLCPVDVSAACDSVGSVARPSGLTDGSAPAGPFVCRLLTLPPRPNGSKAMSMR